MASSSRRAKKTHKAKLVLVGRQGHAFEIRNGNYLAGRLLVRNGSLVWWPVRTKDYSYRVTWRRLDDATFSGEGGWSRRKGRWDPRTIL